MNKSILSFTAVLLIIALLGVICFTGVDFGFFAIPPITDTDEGVRLGLDLVGGSIITYEAMIEEEMDADTLDANMNAVESMLRSRLDQLELFEATIYRAGDKRITVEIPSITNPEEAVQKLGSTAKLQFLDADGNLVIEGKEVEKSEALNGAVDQTGILQNYVKLTLNSEAASKFTEATKIAANAEEGKNYIDIQLDGETISMPHVGSEYKNTGVSGGTVIITGGFTPEDANWLANVIAAGQLPFELEEVELRSVGAQLGMRALETSIQAGLIGVLLVMVFMVVIYRLPGVVASIALTFYTVIVLICLSALKVNLSLPGIAGIILSIGMAVDANVVIFERIKEELKIGKTIKASIDSGFDRAFGAILDSNVTTMIAAVVLYFFGTGTIKGFALTLGLGIVVSMFTALTVTHFLLNRMVDFKLNNLKFYGVSDKEVA
ncbi:MAG: protein translocase subunit SecD [Clostridia bacterium]|nr:protein translocase subunit SecD [Clostridia bacterium]